MSNKLQITYDGVSTGTLFSPDGNQLVFQSSNQISIYDFTRPAGQERIDTKITALLSNVAWLNNDALLILSDKTVTIIKSDGSQQVMNVNPDSIPAGITNVVAGNGVVYLFAADGIYQLPINAGL